MARVPNPPAPVSPWPTIIHQLVAFHLGAWRSDGTRLPAEAYAAATKWVTPESPTLFAMQRALRDGDPLYNERHQDALRRMFAARGVDFEGGDHDAIGRTTYDLYCEAKAGGMPLPEVPGVEREAMVPAFAGEGGRSSGRDRALSREKSAD
jgi:hypothetical protein